MDCPICYGTGRVRLDPGGKKINPAFVASTFQGTDDELSAIVDRVMCELRKSDKTLKHFLVLWAEFVRPNGTQEMKAEQIRKANRINLSHENYRYHLHNGLRLVENGIDGVITTHNISPHKMAI